MIKNWLLNQLYCLLFPKSKRIYQDQLPLYHSPHSIGNLFEKRSYQYDSHGYTVVPSRKRDEFEFISLYQERHSIEKSVYYLLPNMRCYAPHGVCMTDSDKVIMNSVKNRSAYLKRSGAFKKRVSFWQRKKVTRLKVALSLVDMIGANYYHFVNDLLTLLPAYESYSQEFFIKPYIILEKDAPIFQHQWLSLLGFPAENVIELTSDLIVETLIVPTLHFQKVSYPHKNKLSFLLDQSAFLWLREKISHAPINEEKPDRKIFISRERAASRKILNEASVFKFLSHAGFEKVIMEELEVKDQVRLFKEASVVVTAHGAALTNLIFSSNCTVVEFFPEGRYTESTSTFYQISQMFRLDHLVIVCETTSEDEDMILDVDKLGLIMQENNLL